VVSASEDLTPDERRLVGEVLSDEYSVLMSGLSSAWSASLTRTSIFIYSLSAAGVALGFVAQEGLDQGPFRTLALVVLPLVLFLGIATFVRLVQVQRESVIYITGMNRIRHFFQERAPRSRPYFVLPANDDETALYRSFGTGMNRRPPRRALLYLVVQTQGIVGVLAARLRRRSAASPPRPPAPESRGWWRLSPSRPRLPLCSRTGSAHSPRSGPPSGPSIPRLPTRWTHRSDGQWRWSSHWAPVF
jgi:hypothetical protein